MGTLSQLRPARRIVTTKRRAAAGAMADAFTVRVALRLLS
jgi:hypothetical protein